MKNRIQFILCLCVALFVSAVCRAQKAELIVQTGHSASVTSVAFSADGKTLASGSRDNKIKLWEVATDRELRTLAGHSDSVTSVAFSADGKMLASGSEDKTIKLWEVATGRELRTLSGHSFYVSSVAFSADGNTLASGSWDKTIKLWEVATGRELHKLPRQADSVTSVAFSADGTLASIGGATIKLWEVSTGRELRTLAGHSRMVDSIAFSTDGKTLASGSEDKTIKLWEVSTGRELRTLAGHSNGVNSVAFSADGKTLASGSRDETIKLWEVDTGRELRTLTGHSDYVESVALSADGKTLASASKDHTFVLWEVSTGRKLHTFAGESEGFRPVAFSADGKTLATGSWDQPIKLWEVATGRELRTLAEHSSGVLSVALSADGKTLASGSEDDPIKLWEVATGRELRTLTGHSGAILSVTFSADGKTLASGSADHTIKLWEVSTGRELRTLTGHSNGIFSVAFSADGKTLASGSRDETIKLWEVATGRGLHTLEGHSDLVRAVAFSADGKALASGSWDNTIKLWEVATGRELRTFTGHSNEVFSVAFSVDGKTLASGSEDHTIKLWELATGRELATLTGHSSIVTSVAFSADGKFLLSGDRDATIKLWRVATGDLLASLVALNKKDWTVITPDGLFDASPGARRLMHYVVGMESVTLDQMKDLYYVPGLLQKVMPGGPLPKVELFTAQDLFPEAEYEQVKPGQKAFIVNLRNRGGGIGPTQVLVNGTEVIADARPSGLDPQAKQAKLIIDLSNVKQLLPGQENKVEVITRNAAGSLSSKDSTRGVKVVFVGDGKALTQAPELYAIIGGVSKYTGDQLNLRYSAKDAEDFARALEIGATKLLSQDKVHIRLLVSDKNENKKLLTGPDSSELSPSKENFRKVFAEFAGKAKQNDTLVVYLSGHGVALARQGGDSYLYLSEEAYTTDSTALSEEKIRTAITVSSEELVQWIKEIPTLKKALVLDTCAAGAAAESLLAKKDIPSDQIRALERLKDRTGFFVLMGSAADKVSYETTTYRQGLLTYSLLEALKGAKLHSGGYANVGQLFDYAQDRVPQLARNIGAIQQPRALAPDIGSPFDIGLYTPDEQKLFSLPSPNPLILRPSLQNKDLGYDNLKLLPILQRALLEASYVAARGSNESSLVFVDASEMPDAFMPVGSYTVVNDRVEIILNLIRNDKPVAKVVVKGPITDEASKTALVHKLVAAITAETQKTLE
jgi:WD40 repeat protein/uncharacterized caspase-like protein